MIFLKQAVATLTSKCGKRQAHIIYVGKSRSSIYDWLVAMFGGENHVHVCDGWQGAEYFLTKIWRRILFLLGTLAAGRFRSGTDAGSVR